MQGGGVALNCVANGKLLRSGLFDDIWIQPASGYAGGVVGCTLFTWYHYLNNQRKAVDKSGFMKGAFLGPEFLNVRCLTAQSAGILYTKIHNQ